MSKKEDLFFTKLKKKQLEVSSIPPQDFGSLTPYYKAVTWRLKVAPWRVIIPAALISVFMVRFFLGNSFVNIVSILQEGF